MIEHSMLPRRSALGGDHKQFVIQSLQQTKIKVLVVENEIFVPELKTKYVSWGKSRPDDFRERAKVMDDRFPITLRVINKFRRKKWSVVCD